MIILFGLLFTICMTAFWGLLITGSEGGRFLIYINMSSLLIIIIPVLFYFLVTKSVETVRRYIISSFKRGYTFKAAELESLAKAMQGARNVIIAAGVFGFFGGIIAILTSLSVPEEIGPNFAVAMITVHYAVSAGYFIFYPTQMWAEAKVKALREEAAAEQQ